VLTAGRLPAGAAQIVLGPTTARALHVGIGSAVRLTGGAVPRAMTVTGIGFVPAGPHNNYDDGAWLTPAGFDWLFRGAHYGFKFHFAALTLRPGASVQAVAGRLDADAASIKGGAAFMFMPPSPPAEVQIIKDVVVLPLALSGFLAVLAAGAVGHALALAVRRRRGELAVLRALGLTRRQARMVVITHGSVLAAIGLAVGIPLGIVIGRDVWRVVAGFIPLAYLPPLALWALVLIGPLTVLAANMLAVWPGRHAAGLRPGQVLRSELGWCYRTSSKWGYPRGNLRRRREGRWPGQDPGSDPGGGEVRRPGDGEQVRLRDPVRRHGAGRRDREAGAAAVVRVRASARPGAPGAGVPFLRDTRLLAFRDAE
jgi:hypothetical protein